MRWRDVPPISSNGSKNPEDPNAPSKPTSSSTTDKRHFKSWSHCFSMLLLIGYYYYTLCVPMKVTLDQNSNKYVVKEWRIQKFLCYVSWTIATIKRLTVVRTTYVNTNYHYHTTVSYFRLSHALLHVIYYAIYYHMISTSSSSILAFLNGIRASSLFTMSKTRNQVLRWSLLTTLALWALLYITAIPVGHEVLSSNCWSFRNLMHAYIVHGSYTFFNTSKILPEADTTDYNGVDIVLGIGQVLLNTSDVILLFFTNCLLGNYAATLWANASGFCEAILSKLKESHEDQVERNEEESPQVLELFEQATAVSTPLNSTFQLLAFWYMLDFISWFSTELVTVLRTKDYFLKTLIFFYLSYIGVSVCLSAEAFRAIERLKNILRTRDRKKLAEKRNNDLDSLFKYLQTQNFGIGETGFFKINYAFIGQISGLIITFYIISIGEIRKMSDMDMENRNMTNSCYMT